MQRLNAVQLWKRCKKASCSLKNQSKCWFILWSTVSLFSFTKRCSLYVNFIAKSSIITRLFFHDCSEPRSTVSTAAEWSSFDVFIGPVQIAVFMTSLPFQLKMDVLPVITQLPWIKSRVYQCFPNRVAPQPKKAHYFTHFPFFFSFFQCLH